MGKETEPIVVSRTLRIAGIDGDERAARPEGTCVLRSAGVEVRQRIDKWSSEARIGLGLAAALLIFAAIVAYYAHSSIAVVQGILAAFEVSAALLGVVFFLYTIPWGRRQQELELFEIDQELDLLGFYNATDELRAERLFKLHQAELSKYYEIARSQSVQIFYVGVIFMIAGILIIGTALLLIAVGLQTSQLSDKLVVASLGAVGSLLSNFVGAIYIRMYSGTVTSLASFHSRLVGTHHLHYGSFLAAKITDRSLREQTLSRMAINTSAAPSVDPQTDDASIATVADVPRLSRP